MSHWQSHVLAAIIACGLVSSLAQANPNRKLRLAILENDNLALLQAVDLGANLFLKTRRDGSWVDLAARNRSDRALVTLLGLWQRAALLEDTRETPLHVAVRYNAKEAVLRLLDVGFGVNRPGRYGWTPLHVAIDRELCEIAQILLQRGARANMRTRAGEYPVHMAAQAQRYSQRALLKLLRHYGADLSAVSIDGRNALHYAMQNPEPNVIQYLHDIAVEPRVDIFGQTPLDHARMLEGVDEQPRLAYLSPRIAAFISPRTQ